MDQALDNQALDNQASDNQAGGYQAGGGRPAGFWLDEPETLLWACGQTNAALADARAVAIAERMLRNAAVPLHPDPPKNWDTALALIHAMAHVDPGAPVMDAGAERYSSFLPALRSHGFGDLTGINLTFGEPFIADGIRFRHGDITRLPFADAGFAFIACLSVIEHGVDTALFLAECARLLRPGGHLFVSFDYWREPVETQGAMAYGAPIRIFDEAGVADIVAEARRSGLQPVSGFEAACADRVVHWRRFDLRYTFANLLLSKQD